MPKRVTSGEANFRGLAPGQDSCIQTSLQWRADGDTVSNLNSPVIEPKSCHKDNVILNQYTNQSILVKIIS